MKIYSLSKAVALAGLASVLVLGLGTQAEAQERIKWKMHSAFGSKIAVVGPSMERIARQVKAISGGTLELKFFEPGALVPGIDYLDAVAKGSIDGAFGTSGYHAGKLPALSFFTAVPFGPRAGEYLAWMKYGGGYEIYDEFYKGLGVKGLICGAIPPEASGWFRKEIKSVDDLRGLKMRFFGLGALVMAKLGVSTQLLAGGDIYPALERGVIDAAEFSMPALDESYGFFQIAKHYYFPGWHQQTTLNELIFNRKKYEALSDTHKAILETVCGYNIAEQFTEGAAIQFSAMKRMQEKGVTIHRWPEEILAKFEAAWNEVVAELVAKDPNFKRVWESYSSFRKDYAIWKDHGFLE